MKHIVQLAKSGPRMKIAFDKKVADHFGPKGTLIAMYARRDGDGRFTVWLKRDHNSRHKMHPYMKQLLPFCVDITSDNPVFNSWPDTKPMKPIELEAVLIENHRIEFSVMVDPVAGLRPVTGNDVDNKSLESSMKALKEKLIDYGAGPKTIDKIISTQPQPQASPISPVTVKDSRGDFLAALSAFNKALNPDLNDIELTVERLNDEGKPVEVIKLPPPSLMRIRGRVIKEEIFE